MKQTIGILLALCMSLRLISVREVSAAPSVSAQAYVLMEAATGTVLCGEALHEKRPMASTTKIMTTLLTLEQPELDRPFRVDSAAIHVEGSSMGLREGDIVTLRALCCGMLLPSGNDAANAAAVAVAGSIPAFAERMNERAWELGMQDTQFVTPSGLEAEGHGSSPYDMALLTRAALENADFRQICCQPSAVVTFGDPPFERTLYNSNKLLKLCDGVIGVKTGFTDEAGRCLVSACEREGVTLLCVTLHAPDDWNDHKKLYDYGFARVKPAAADPGALPEIPVTGGTERTVPVHPGREVIVGALEGIPSGITVTIRHAPFLYAPVREGDAVGEIVYTCQDRRIAVVPLLADKPIPMLPLPEKVDHFWERAGKES